MATTLWKVDRTRLTRPSQSRRQISRKPLFDLAGLQQAIKSNALDPDSVLLGTRSVDDELQKLTWEVSDLLDCIACLHPSDFRNAQWCRDRHGTWYPCDSYAIRYDEYGRCRAPQSGIEFYVKFSIDEEGSLTLVMLRLHLSR